VSFSVTRARGRGLKVVNAKGSVLYVFYTYRCQLMQKKLTITVDEKVYEGLYSIVGRRRISRFIEDLVRPRISQQHLEAAYEQMAQDEKREADAFAWSEGTVGDVADETR